MSPRCLVIPTRCRLSAVALGAAVLASTVSPAIAEEPSARRFTAEQLEFFEKRVRPVLAEHCFKCHGPKEQKGGLRLDSRAAVLKGGETGPAVIPGQPDESELVSAINYAADGYQMPPTGKLPAEHIAALTEWVRMGVPWPADRPAAADNSGGGEIDLAARAQHWSFQPLQRISPPAVRQTDWPRTPVDHFILAGLERAGLSPAPETDRRSLLRRITFDLIGLPPTPEEIEAFLADHSPDAYERVVEHLLASPHYGERWGRHWLDLVRFAETAGHEFDYEIPQAWPYRDYVIRAFNEDLPYDQFVTEQIAGDLLPEPRRNSAGLNESILGTAFYWFAQGKHSPVDIRAEECDRIDNQLDVLGKTFLGLTIACARCHDHKFDPVTTRDYYAMAGFLQSTRQQLAFLYPDSRRALTTGELQGPARADPPRADRAADGSRADDADWDRLVAEHRVVSTRLAQRLLRRGAEQVESQWPLLRGSLAEDAARSLASPWHAWAVLGQIRDPAEFARQRDALLQRLRAESEKSADAVLVADGLPETDPPDNSRAAGPHQPAGVLRGRAGMRWHRSGRAFAHPVDLWGALRWSADGRLEAVPPAAAHSGLLADGLQGVLRSDTFTISKKFIHYRVRRVGGKPNPGVRHKNGELHLIVGGFHMIQNPLWGHLTINTSNDGQFRWYSQNVEKLLGQRAFIEIADEDDGHIVVERIVFSDSSHPTETPHPFLVRVLADPEVKSAEDLLRKYGALARQSLALWESGRLDGAPDAAAHGRLLGSMLALALGSGQLEASDPDANRLRTRQAQLAALADASPPFRALAAADGNGLNEHLLIRGNHKKPEAEVPRRFLEVFVGPEGIEGVTGSGRLQLAGQLTDAATNPLLARVIVNRLWLHHFGRGIVPTPDNFGVLGEPPTHPELLDHLAAELIRRNWSLKQLHRQLVLSSTYRMSSRPDVEHAETLDPDNRLLHRMNVRRLEAEAVRDAVLAVSGRLDRRMFGPGVLPYLTPFMEGRGRPASGPLDGDGRRSLYINVRRNFLTPMFLAFDYPTPLSTMGRRSTSNVPAQALALMNNPLVVSQANLWAQRALNADAAPAARIALLYVMGFGREPSGEELAAALEFLDVQSREYGGQNDRRAWADLCHVLMNVKEFVFVP